MVPLHNVFCLSYDSSMPSPIFEMSNVLQKIKHLAEYVSFSTFCHQYLNLSPSNHQSTNVTLYFLLDIKMSAETIGEKFRLRRHIQKSKLYCISSKSFQNKFLKYKNQKIPGDLVIFFQNPDSKSFQECIKFPGISKRVATLVEIKFQENKSL